MIEVLALLACMLAGQGVYLAGRWLWRQEWWQEHLREAQEAEDRARYD